MAGTNTYEVFTMGFDWLPGEQYVDKTRIEPFIHIHSSPYIDFTSGHMYPTSPAAQ